MARRKKRHEYFNTVPKFFTTDVANACMVFELKNQINGMGTIEALYSCVKKVRYDGTDSLLEDPVGADARTIFLELRTGSFLPEEYDGLEITWYEHESDPSKQINLEDILVMCSI